jgi:hypothetical protein
MEEASSAGKYSKYRWRRFQLLVSTLQTDGGGSSAGKYCTEWTDGKYSKIDKLRRFHLLVSTLYIHTDGGGFNCW